MFTPEERARLRSELLARAERDPRIVGAAITGSAAAGTEDEWSDIDLAFGVGAADDVPGVLLDWTSHMYGERCAVHHVDIRAGAWTYRVFLLANTLQVDLAFVPAAEFQALSPTFRLVFGTAKEAQEIPLPAPAELAGLGWLYALHARTCIARRRFWQAEYMISGVRGHALALACMRHGLPSVHGRGMDQLPPEVTAKFEASFVARLGMEDLQRAFRAALSGLIDEIHAADPKLGRDLESTLRALA